MRIVGGLVFLVVWNIYLIYFLLYSRIRGFFVLSKFVMFSVKEIIMYIVLFAFFCFLELSFLYN